MGLITKEVEVRLAGQNVKYYEDLGYEIPRYFNKNSWRWMIKTGTTIKVKVEDLSPNNGKIKVDVECDCCHKKKKLTYSSYAQNYHDDGKYYCIHCSYKMRYSGENNINWNFDITQEERERKRKYPEYTQFVKAVYVRDNYTCQCCGKRQDKDMVAHHLDGYNWCKERRTDVTNGITLCGKCHDAFHQKYGKGKNTKKQFEDWLGHAIEVLNYGGELPTTRKVYCIEENKIYNSVEALGSSWNFPSLSTIYRACDQKDLRTKSVKGKHLLWYDEYLSMTSEEISQYVEKLKIYRGKSVRCITTGEIFLSISNAQKKYPQCPSIWQCCNGVIQSSGSLPDGTRLQWEYYTQTA